MSESEKQTALVPTQSIALTKPGAKSLIARGHVDLRNNEEAEAWLKKGLDFYNNKQYEDAFACYERGIQLNPIHPELQYRIGQLFVDGLGVDRDCLQAAFWYRKSAEQGHSSGQYNLGFMYEGGQGVPQDYTQAAFWYRKSAEQGYSKAQSNLGSMYHRGQGVPQDDTQASSWFHKAAEQGVHLHPLLQRFSEIMKNPRCLKWFEMIDSGLTRNLPLDVAGGVQEAMNLSYSITSMAAIPSTVLIQAIKNDNLGAINKRMRRID